MTIAVPICQQRISPLLDTASRLLVVTRKRGQEVARREYVLDVLPPDALARSIAELPVDILLCGAVSEPLLRELAERGVRVRPHLCGDVERILQAFCRRQLRRNDFRMPGCWEKSTVGSLDPSTPRSVAQTSGRPSSNAPANRSAIPP